MRDLRIALIGAGFMGKAHSLAYAMAPVAFQLPANLQRQVVVEVNEQLAAAAASDFGFAEAATDWRAVVERGDIDIVDIATPNDSHEAIAIAAVDHGKHVLCEKPLALDAPSAERMRQHAEQAGVVNMVGFNYRHTPAIAYAKQLIDDGQLGVPYQLRINYLQDWGLLHEPLAWRFQRSRAGSGAIGDIGSHAIESAEYLLGPIRRVLGCLATHTAERPVPWEGGRVAAVDVDDSAAFLADFEAGATGVFVATRHALFRKNQLAFELDASRGALRFSWDTRDELEVALLDDPEPVSGFRRVSLGPAHPNTLWPIAGIGSGYLETTANQIRDFVNAIVTGSSARPNFADGARVQHVIDAVVASANAGAWVVVPTALGAVR